MEILDVIWILVATIVLVKFCQWFTDQVEREAAAAAAAAFSPSQTVEQDVPSDTVARAASTHVESLARQPRSRNRRAQQHPPKPWRAHSSPAVFGSQHRRLQYTVAQAGPASSRDIVLPTPLPTATTESVDAETQASLGCPGCKSLTAERSTMQRANDKLENDVYMLGLQRRRDQDVNLKQSMNLLGTKNIRDQLAQRTVAERQRAEEAERRLQEAVEALTYAADPNNHPRVSRSHIGTQTSPDSSVVPGGLFDEEEAKHKTTASALAIAECQIAELRKSHRFAEEAENGREKCEGDLRQQVDDARNEARNEKKRAGEQESGREAAVHACDAAQKQANDANKRADEELASRKIAQHECNQAQKKANDEERRADEEETIRTTAENERDEALAKIQEMRENAEEADMKIEELEQEQVRLAAELEKAMRLPETAANERRQIAASHDQANQAIIDRNNALARRDTVVGERDQALSQLLAVTNAHNEALRQIRAAQNEWNQMLAQRDQALAERETAINEFRNAQGREQEAKQAGENVFAQLQGTKRLMEDLKASERERERTQNVAQAPQTQVGSPMHDTAAQQLSSEAETPVHMPESDIDVEAPTDHCIVCKVPKVDGWCERCSPLVGRCPDCGEGIRRGQEVCYRCTPIEYNDMLPGERLLLPEGQDQTQMSDARLLLEQDEAEYGLGPHEVQVDDGEPHLEPEEDLFRDEPYLLPEEPREAQMERDQPQPEPEVAAMHGQADSNSDDVSLNRRHRRRPVEPAPPAATKLPAGPQANNVRRILPVRGKRKDNLFARTLVMERVCPKCKEKFEQDTLQCPFCTVLPGPAADHDPGL